MAQRGIREFDGKRLLKKYWERYLPTLEYPFKAALVEEGHTLKDYLKDHPWLKEEGLVVKPDQLFGKRGKHGLVLLNANFNEAEAWISERMGKEITIGEVKDKLTHFLVEPFVPHKEELYMAMVSEREGDKVYLSEKGGVDIEEVWETVREIFIPISTSEEKLKEIVSEGLPEEFKEKKGVFISFICGLYRLFFDLHFTYLELNPFTILEKKIIPFDLVARLDDTAHFDCAEAWGDITFPAPFGRKLTPEEAHIRSIDERSGASLKLTVLNPKGRIWTMVAGGGASVVYTDTISDMGASKELGNYGEYSGDPSTDETYEYAKTILDLMTRERDPKGRPKVLLIGGGIANFTDVARTFDGIIKALKEYKDKLKNVNAKIYVRRGGPNYETGLTRMRQLGETLGVPIEVYGPETHMTRIVKMALAY